MKPGMEDMKEILAKAIEITKMLPERPENIGKPITILLLAKSMYIEYLRKNLEKGQEETFESLLQQTEVQVDNLVTTVMNEK